MIKVNCPNCNARLTAPDELIGKQVNCQKCNTKFVVSRRWMNAPIAVPGESEASDFGDKPVSSEVSFKNQDLMGSDSDNSISSSPLGIVAANFDPAEAENTYASAVSDGMVPSPPRAAAAFFENSNPAKRQEPVSAERPETTSPVVKRPVEYNKPLESRIDRNSQNQVAIQTAASELEFSSTTPIRSYEETNLLFEFFDFRFRRYLAPGIIRLSWFLLLIVSTVCILFVSYLYLSSLLNRQAFAFPKLRNAAEAKSDTGLKQNEPNVDRKEVALVVPQFVYNSIFYFGCSLLFLVGLLWTRVLFETIIMVFSIGSHLRDTRSRK